MPRFHLELVTREDQARQSPFSNATVLLTNPPSYAVCHERCCTGISDLQLYTHCKQAQINKPHLHPVVDVLVFAQYIQCLRRK